MATYIALGRYTQQGIQNIRGGPARTKAAQKKRASTRRRI